MGKPMVRAPADRIPPFWLEPGRWAAPEWRAWHAVPGARSIGTPPIGSAYPDIRTVEAEH